MKTNSKKKNKAGEAILTGVSAAVGAGIGIAGATAAKDAIARGVGELDNLFDQQEEQEVINVDQDSIFDTELEEHGEGEQEEGVFDSQQQQQQQQQIEPLVGNPDEEESSNDQLESDNQPNEEQVEVIDAVQNNEEDTISVFDNEDSTENHDQPQNNTTAESYIAPEANPNIPTNNDTDQVNITSITVDDKEVMLMDTDGDGIVDIMAVDTNGDLLISEDEKTDISDEGFAIDDSQALEDSFNAEEMAMAQETSSGDDDDYYQAEEDAIVSDANAEDYYMADGTYTIDNGLSDYNNQANVNDYMS